MKKTDFRYEGTHWPLAFFEDYPDEATFIAKAGKQHYPKATDEQRVNMLKEVWKQANEIKAANQAEVKPKQTKPPVKPDDKGNEGK